MVDSIVKVDLSPVGRTSRVRALSAGESWQTGRRRFLTGVNIPGFRLLCRSNGDWWIPPRQPIREHHPHRRRRYLWWRNRNEHDCRQQQRPRRRRRRFRPAQWWWQWQPQLPLPTLSDRLYLETAASFAIIDYSTFASSSKSRSATPQPLATPAIIRRLLSLPVDDGPHLWHSSLLTKVDLTNKNFDIEKTINHITVLHF